MTNQVRKVIEKVVEGFDKGIFVRSTAEDTEAGWAMKLAPYLAALAALQEYLNTPVPMLSQTAARKLGAFSLEYERAQSAEDFLETQKKDYADRPKGDLVEELLRRDEAAFREGRMMADGRMATNLLRELTRHLLQKADASALMQLTGAAKKGKVALLAAMEHGDGGIPGLVAGLLENLGAEPGDLRQLRLHGSMLGDGRTPEERAAEMEGLVDGTIAHTEDLTAGSQRVADDIVEFRKDHVPAEANKGPKA